MKTYNKKLITLVIFSALVINGISQAKVRTIQSRRDFEKTVAKESMVVALFYGDREDKGLMRMYEDVSGYQKYDDADIIFLKINAARKELSDLSAMYGVTTLPTFICFNNGRRVLDNGSPVLLTGSVSRDVLQSFIDKHYGAQIKSYITEKDANNRQRYSQENESWKLYFYPRDMVVPSYGPDERMLE